MPREISGLRIARSFITPTEVRTTRILDFQLGPRQGIAIESILPEIMADPAGFTISSATVGEFTANHTLHLEAGSLETVPDAAGEDEDTIDSEVFFRQSLWIGGNDDSTTEFRASLASLVVPQGKVDYPKPIFSARNISHSGITNGAGLDTLCSVTIFYTFVEFSLAELGLILARRT